MLKLTLAFENESAGPSPSSFEMLTFPSADTAAPSIFPLRLKSDEPL